MRSCTSIELHLQAEFQQLETIATAINRLFTPVIIPGDRDLFIYSIKLAIHEIGNNIIEHAYGGQGGVIRIQLAINEELHQFTADLYDAGRSFDPATVTPPDLDQPQEEGYGLYLAYTLMDDVQYLGRPNQNHWHLMKQW